MQDTEFVRNTRTIRISVKKNIRCSISDWIRIENNMQRQAIDLANRIQEMTQFKIKYAK